MPEGFSALRKKTNHPLDKSLLGNRWYTIMKTKSASSAGTSLTEPWANNWNINIPTYIFKDILLVFFFVCFESNKVYDSKVGKLITLLDVAYIVIRGSSLIWQGGNEDIETRSLKF